MTKSLVSAPDCNLTALFHNPEASAIIKRTKSDSTCKHIRGKKKKKQNVTVSIRNARSSFSLVCTSSSSELADLWSPSKILCSRVSVGEGQVQGNCLTLTKGVEILVETHTVRHAMFYPYCPPFDFLTHASWGKIDSTDD